MARFSNTSDLRERLKQIHESDDHRNLGKWSTAQIYYHLAAAFEASVDSTSLPSGFPPIVRWFIRPMRRLVTHVRFPPWLPIPAAIEFKLKPPAGLDLTEQAKRLLSAIQEFEQHTGEMPPHPVLGRLSRSEWLGFHLRHCEHHLSFIQLVEDESSNGQ